MILDSFKNFGYISNLPMKIYKDIILNLTDIKSEYVLLETEDEYILYIYVYSLFKKPLDKDILDYYILLSLISVLVKLSGEGVLKTMSPSIYNQYMSILKNSKLCIYKSYEEFLNDFDREYVENEMPDAIESFKIKDNPNELKVLYKLEIPKNKIDLLPVKFKNFLLSL